MYANRQYFLSTILFLLIGLVLLFIRPIYDLIGQDSEVADLATQYVHTIYPFHFFEMTANVFVASYAMNCRVTHYLVIMIVSGTVCHAILVYIFCIHNSWGYDGVVWATGL